MQSVKSLYDAIERNFFDTLTKKLSSLFLLVLVSGLLFWVAISLRADIVQLLHGSQIDPALLKQVEDEADTRPAAPAATMMALFPVACSIKI